MTILTPLSATVTRRGFLAGGAGLSLAFVLGPVPRLASAAEAQSAGFSPRAGGPPARGG